MTDTERRDGGGDESVETVAFSGFHQPRPHGVPVGIVAPAPVARTVQRELGHHISGGFDLTSLASERQARLAIERRSA